MAVTFDRFDQRKVSDVQFVSGPAHLDQQGTGRGGVDGVRPLDDQLLTVAGDRDGSPFDPSRGVDGLQIDNVPAGRQ